jgi:hypothetical protein
VDDYMRVWDRDDSILYYDCDVDWNNVGLPEQIQCKEVTFDDVSDCVVMAGDGELYDCDVVKGVVNGWDVYGLISFPCNGDEFRVYCEIDGEMMEGPLRQWDEWSLIGDLYTVGYEIGWIERIEVVSESRSGEGVDVSTLLADLSALGEFQSFLHSKL